ncbi:unnamed protein product, partial [Polarella glacialis]
MGVQRPWSSMPSQPKTMPDRSTAARKPLFAKRVQGTVQEWKGFYGWVVPLQSIKSPLPGQQNGGRIYLQKKDLRRQSSVPAVGALVEFSVYSDRQGLGAGDCCEVPSSPAEEADSPAAGAARSADAGEEDLPEGWKRVWSDDDSEWYYWNSDKKESSWTHPNAAEEDGNDEPLPE